MDLRFLVPTSNVVEELFSVAGYSQNKRRMSMLPINFEAQLFLKTNSDYWSILTLAKAFNAVSEQDKKVLESCDQIGQESDDEDD
jgi:hypothetical protein